MKVHVIRSEKEEEKGIFKKKKRTWYHGKLSIELSPDEQVVWEQQKKVLKDQRVFEFAVEDPISNDPEDQFRDYLVGGLIENGWGQGSYDLVVVNRFLEEAKDGCGKVKNALDEYAKGGEEEESFEL